MNFKQAFDGAKILSDWLGSGGKAVPAAQSQARSDVCTGRLSGQSCPYNWGGKWIVPQAIADTIRFTLEVKNQMKLRVEGEDKIGHCECCGCILSLKVHCPTEKILSHTSPEQFTKYWRGCWLLTETKNTKTP